MIAAEGAPRRAERRAPRAPLGLKPGDWVEVRSAWDVRATLDADGTLDGLPFMPEMLPFCGRLAQVRARADRTSVSGLMMRTMEHTVHLEGARCSGAAHDGCARSCLLFWKEAWLKRAGAGRDVVPVAAPPVLRTRVGDRYVCQASELGRATRHLPAHALHVHIAALTNEGLGVVDLARALAIFAHDTLAVRVLGRADWNTIPGSCLATPAPSLGLRPGERVRVKSAAEIVATLDANGWNRKMEFAREMLQHCGGEYTVLRRVDRLVRDHTGTMVRVKNTVILDGLVFKDMTRLACPRGEYMFWRECWLERAGPESDVR